MKFSRLGMLVIFAFFVAGTLSAMPPRVEYQILVRHRTPSNFKRQTGTSPINSTRELIKKLSTKGITVRRGGKVTQPFLSVPGQILKMPGGEIQVFEYKSSKTAASESNKVGSDGSPIGTTMVTWIATPHFFKSGRVIVLYVGSEQGVITHLEKALGHQFAGK